jgi:hypothetical protein
VDGVTETIINNLSRLPKMRVVPRGVVFRCRGKGVDPFTAASELAVVSALASAERYRGRSLPALLAGLMSRWTIPRAWAVSRASTIWTAISSKSSASNGPASMRCFSVRRHRGIPWR